MIESNTGNVVEKVFENDSKLLSVAPFDEGNVLYSKLRPYLNKVVIPNGKGYATTELVPLRPNQKLLNLTFFSHLLRGDDFVSYANSISSGTKMPRMPLNDLRKFPCILPPMEKQNEFEEIAHQSDKSGFDGHKSQFIEMFGDPIKNTMKLLSRKGEELFVFSSGKANTKSNLSNDFPYNCYGGNGITGHSNQWLIDYPTIVIGRVGEYCGCVHKTQGKVWITDNAIYIKEHKKNVFDDAFLFYLMTYLDFHRLADETGQPKITQRPLLDMEYIIPSKDLQQKFISIAEQADKSGSVLQYRIAC